MIELFNHECFYDLAAPPLFLSHSRVARVEEADSDSRDFSPTPSLAEVSSDGLSWLDDKDLGEKESCLNGKMHPVQFPSAPTVMLHAESSHQLHKPSAHLRVRQRKVLTIGSHAPNERERYTECQMGTD